MSLLEPQFSNASPLRHCRDCLVDWGIKTIDGGVAHVETKIIHYTIIIVCDFGNKTPYFAYFSEKYTHNITIIRVNTNKKIINLRITCISAAGKYYTIIDQK